MRHGGILAPRSLAAVLRLAGAWALAGFLCAPAPALGVEQEKHVLVLYSLPRMQPVIVEGDRGLHQAIRTTASQPVLVFDESLDAPRFAGESYERTVITYLRDKYASQRPSVIVAVAETSLRFLLHHRAELFAGIPIVHCGVDAQFLQPLAPLPADVVGVPVRFDFVPSIELALRWHPRARRLVVVTGTADVDRQWERMMRADVSRFSDRVTAEFIAGRPMEEVLARLAWLGRDTVVWTSGFFQDGTGRGFVPAAAFEAMAAASAAPVYSSFSTVVGAGGVGAYTLGFESIGRQCGELVNGLLAGTAPSALRLPEAQPLELVVDWRQIRRWGISPSAIPDDAVVLFKPPPLLEAYRNQVLAGVMVGLLQATLIGFFVVERLRRRRAEAARDVQRRELAHASRLAAAGELTGAIAHEINQPLGAILSNADAADLILDSGAERRDEVRAILADIRRDDRRASEVIHRLRSLLAKHDVERRPFDLNLVLSDVESVLGGEARRRRVAFHTQTAPKPVTISGDPIQIQQVLINLVLNAMDAVADAPDDRRTVDLVVEAEGGRATVAVRDHGHGIAPGHLPRLFDSFFSTKRDGMGLGLSIARNLIESHGGRIWAENGPDTGAVFRIELPTERTAGASPLEPR
jgi:signal transduction histidine kinase